MRVTVYRNDLSDAVTNVTLTSTPTLITRQRQNVSNIAAVGIETEGEWRVAASNCIEAITYTALRFQQLPHSTSLQQYPQPIHH